MNKQEVIGQIIQTMNDNSVSLEDIWRELIDDTCIRICKYRADIDKASSDAEFEKITKEHCYGCPVMRM